MPTSAAIVLVGVSSEEGIVRRECGASFSGRTSRSSYDRCSISESCPVHVFLPAVSVLYGLEGFSA